MFLPNKSTFKYKRYHRAHLVPAVVKFIDFPHVRTGAFGLKILRFGFIFPQQLKALYQTLNKSLKKKGRIFIYAYPKHAFTCKPTGARMGKGKGRQLSSWVFCILSGFVLCEIHTRFFKLAIAVLKIAQKKLPLPTKIIKNYITK